MTELFGQKGVLIREGLLYLTVHLNSNLCLLLTSLKACQIVCKLILHFTCFGTKDNYMKILFCLLIHHLHMQIYYHYLVKCPVVKTLHVIN